MLIVVRKLSNINRVTPPRNLRGREEKEIEGTGVVEHDVAPDGCAKEIREHRELLWDRWDGLALKRVRFEMDDDAIVLDLEVAREVGRDLKDLESCPTEKLEWHNGKSNSRA